LSILHKEVKIVKFAARNYLRYLGAITDDGNFMVECYDADFALGSDLRKVIDLLFDSCLHALKPRDVCLVLFSASPELVGSITESHKFGKLVFFIVLKLEIALDRLSHTHGSRDVVAVNFSDVLSCVAELLV